MNPRIRAVVRPPVMAVNTPLARRRTEKAVATLPRPMKLEVGGLQQRPGWLVTNVNAVTKHYLDATTAWPMEAGSLSHVYADNVIEHLTLEQGRALLREAFRCLQPGGAIRLVTPDLGKHVQQFLQGEAATASPLAQAYRDLGLVVEHPIDLVRIPVENYGHHYGYVYDTPALSAELERAGFVDVTECAFGQSDDPVLHGLDQRTDEGPGQMALEAHKPGDPSSARG